MEGIWTELFSKKILARGREYFSMGKAKKLTEEYNGYSATVRGTRNYKVRLYTEIEYDLEYLKNMSCTCPYAQDGHFCKHMAAVLYLVEEEYYPLVFQWEDFKTVKNENIGRSGAADSVKAASVDQETTSAKKQSAAEATGKAVSKEGVSGTAASASQNSGTSSPGNRKSAKKPVPAEQDKTSALPVSAPITRGLADLLSEEHRQMEADLAESSESNGSGETTALPPRHMEPYRYFNWKKFADTVEISREDREKAVKLAGGKDFKDIKVEFGFPSYNSWEREERDGMLGVATAYFDRGFSKTSLVFESDRIIEESCTYWKCRGGRYGRYNGKKIPLCQHSAALLIRLQEYLEKENPGDATSLYGLNMLNKTGQGELTLSETEKMEAEAVQIQPVIDIPEYLGDGEYIPSVSFRVGTSRMYKVRKIREFVEAMKAGEEMRFGTKTVIRLGESLLTEDSRVWYRVMKDALREERQRNLALDPYYSKGYSSGMAIGSQIQGSIPLYGAALDSFYKDAEGKRIEFTIRSAGERDSWRAKEVKTKASLLFCEKEMDLQVEISPFYSEIIPAFDGGRNRRGRSTSENNRNGSAGEGGHSSSHGIMQGIRITGEVPKLIEGRDASYFVDEKNGEFCRVDRGQVEKAAPLLGAAKDGVIDARIGRRNLREFYQRTLPQLRNAVNVIEYDKEIVQSYLPPDPVFVYYFDIENGVVMCRPDVHYGMQIHTILDLLPDMPWSGKIEPYRDEEKESLALDAILKYIPKVFIEYRVLAVDRDDEEFMFNLLAYGLEELMSFGEVRMTEAFRRLGLRRHMKFSIGVSVESSLMDLQILSEDLSEEELLSIFYSYQKKRKFVVLKNGDFLQLDENETIENLLEIMETMGVSLKEFVRGKMQVPIYRALYLDKMLEQMQDVYTERDRRFKSLIKEFKTVEDSDYEVPTSLRSTLRKYQVAGYRWLRTLDHYGFGGILADEMGLGKTLQVITVLLAFKNSAAAGEVSTVGEAFPAGKASSTGEIPAVETGGISAVETGGISAVETGGISAVETGEIPAVETGEIPAVETGAAETKTSQNLPELAVADVSLIICPASLVYNWGEELHRFAPQLKAGLVTGTKKERSAVIRDYRNYDVLVTSYDLLKRDIDTYEGKKFRFEVIDEAQYIKNHGTAAAKSVKLIDAQTRYALTGTPIENRLSELWSIFDYLMPGFLYTYAQFHADFEQPIVKFENDEAMERLRRMVTPFILRRRKEDVLRDLPDKLEEVRYAGMGTKQRKLYDGQVVRMRSSMKKKSESDFRRSRIEIFAELTRIRQICCDPSLILENYDGGSAKREACMDLIRGVVEGEHKALVFSQFTSMLELLEKDLKDAGISFYKITGSTPKERRIELVKVFNSDDVPVFLISLKAGGTGLNLTGADVVIHYDPWWNVAAQNQATDRAHRIGQTRIVTVYKLIAKGTIEERILEMQENKEKLAEDILSGENIGSSAISREDLLELLG